LNRYRRRLAVVGSLSSSCSTSSGFTMTTLKFSLATWSSRLSTLAPKLRLLSSSGVDVGLPGGGDLNDPVEN